MIIASLWPLWLGKVFLSFLRIYILKSVNLLQVNNEFGGVAGGQLVSPGSAYQSSSYDLGAASDIMNHIQSQLHELSLTDDSDTNQSSRFRVARKPPSTYLCHLCFQKGHFIKDCPQVLASEMMMIIQVIMIEYNTFIAYFGYYRSEGGINCCVRPFCVKKTRKKTCRPSAVILCSRPLRAAQP